MFKSIENIIVAVSNITCLYPIYLSYCKGDYVSLATFSLFLARLLFRTYLSRIPKAALHKHHMPGFWYK